MINVYYWKPDSDSKSIDGGSIVSCPISSLGDGCQSLGLTNLPEPYPDSMAASLDFIYLGYGAGAADNDKTGYIYRCPLTSGGVCVQFGDAGNRPILSLVLANGRLYAGLGRDGIASFKEGLIWNCDPTVANSCYDFSNPGKTDVNALAVGVGALVIYGRPC